MSALLAALERIESGRRSGPRSAVGAAPSAERQLPNATATVSCSPREQVSLPLATVVAEPSPAPLDLVDREPPPRTLRRTRYTAAAAALADLFASSGVVAIVSCDLAVGGAEIALGLGDALSSLGVGPVEIVGPGVLDTFAERDFDPSALRARASLVLVNLSAEQATARSHALARLDGVIMLVEADRTSTRAADVTATTLRMQGVEVQGVIVLK